MLDLVMLLETTPESFCSQTANVWQVIGIALMIFKIIIPVLLIIFGMIDLGKAVISSKEDEIKKSTMSLAKRAAAGIVIFFIPTLVAVIIGLVQKENDWEVCRKCISNPMNDKPIVEGKDGSGGCDSHARKVWNAQDAEE